MSRTMRPTPQTYPEGTVAKIQALGWKPHTVPGWWTGRRGNRVAYTDGITHIVETVE